MVGGVMEERITKAALIDQSRAQADLLRFDSASHAGWPRADDEQVEIRGKERVGDRAHHVSRPGMLVGANTSSANSGSLILIRLTLTFDLRSVREYVNAGPIRSTICSVDLELHPGEQQAQTRCIPLVL